MEGLGVYGSGGITVVLNPNNNETQNAIILILGTPKMAPLILENPLLVRTLNPKL